MLSGREHIYLMIIGAITLLLMIAVITYVPQQ